MKTKLDKFKQSFKLRKRLIFRQKVNMKIFKIPSAFQVKTQMVKEILIRKLKIIYQIEKIK